MAQYGRIEIHLADLLEKSGLRPSYEVMVRGGNLGVKSGRGFYVYNADRTKTPVDAQ